MLPEEKARIKIDQWFYDAGWEVVNRDQYTPTSTAVAIREGLLKGNLEKIYRNIIKPTNGHCLCYIHPMVKSYYLRIIGIMTLILKKSTVFIHRGRLSRYLV